MKKINCWGASSSYLETVTFEFLKDELNFIRRIRSGILSLRQNINSLIYMSTLQIWRLQYFGPL